MIGSRRSKSAFTFSDLPKEAWLAGAVPLVVLVLLFVLSQSSDITSRMGALEQQTQAMERAAKADGDLQRYPIGSICSGDFNDAMKNQLASAVMNTGLTVATFDVTQKGRVGLSRPLMAYSVTLKGSGTYEQAVNSLQVLAHARPRLFLDTLSLRNQTSSVDLDVEGRLYCR